MLWEQTQWGCHPQLCGLCPIQGHKLMHPWNAGHDLFAKSYALFFLICTVFVNLPSPLSAELHPQGKAPFANQQKSTLRARVGLLGLEPWDIGDFRLYDHSTVPLTQWFPEWFRNSSLTKVRILMVLFLFLFLSLSSSLPPSLLPSLHSSFPSWLLSFLSSSCFLVFLVLWSWETIKYSKRKRTQKKLHVFVFVKWAPERLLTLIP